MENKGNIESISVNTGKNGKTFYKLKINGHNFSIFADTEAYNQLATNQFKTGETVGYDYTETPGSFNGKAITYKNIVKFTKTEQAQHVNLPNQSQPTQAKPDNSDVWERKDRRIVRMASINAAVELMKINFPALSEEVQAGGVSPTLILGLAKQFEEWVYREAEGE